MKNRWAQGIEPRFFTWVLKDQLAVSERPGGYSRNHRRVRRHEEILWLRQEGFTRVVSLLPSEHNLHAYEELDMPFSHLPFALDEDPRLVLPFVFNSLQKWLDDGERILVHREEVGDDIMGLLAAFLLYTKKLHSTNQAISAIEHLLHRQMGASGRELVVSQASQAS
jgi:hypothetical protein